MAEKEPEKVKQGSRLQGEASTSEESRHQQPNRELRSQLEKTLHPDPGEAIQKRKREIER